MDVQWEGPFAWPRYETQERIPAIPKISGVYLQTVKYQNGYLIYCAGITRRSIPTRFREHTRKYISGEYTVLDIEELQLGRRVEIWHGWGWTPEKISSFERRKEEIVGAAQRQMAGFRVFVADVGTAPRVLERLEAAIMNRLYNQPSPMSDIPDRGMHLSPKLEEEPTISVRIACPEILHGLPQSLAI